VKTAHDCVRSARWATVGTGGARTSTGNSETLLLLVGQRLDDRRRADRGLDVETDDGRPSAKASRSDLGPRALPQGVSRSEARGVGRRRTANGVSEPEMKPNRDGSDDFSLRGA
jgi:hypothetical protein